MSGHDEAWQLFASNGVPIAGSTISPYEARQIGSSNVGAVHIWLWRRNGLDQLEVLLQKRAANKPTWPGYLDISAAGHINAGESLLDAAQRESEEEIGYKIDISRLEYFFSYRNFSNGYKWVYLYELSEDFEFTFNDGEVESLEWVELNKFEKMTIAPDRNNLVPHSPEYFSILLASLRFFNENN